MRGGPCGGRAALGDACLAHDAAERAAVHDQLLRVRHRVWARARRCLQLRRLLGVGLEAVHLSALAEACEHPERVRVVGVQPLRLELEARHVVDTGANVDEARRVVVWALEQPRQQQRQVLEAHRRVDTEAAAVAHLGRRLGLGRVLASEGKGLHGNDAGRRGRCGTRLHYTRNHVYMATNY